MSSPPSAFLADVYRCLPFLVIHTTTDGTVLHCNPETLRTTGYEETELVGKNLWAILFPGKLFAQVPRFISLIQPAALLRDVPMTIKTKRGDERVIAFTRHMHGGSASVNGGGGVDVSDTAGGTRSFICIGVDLTDRLLDADRAQLPEHEFMSPDLSGESRERKRAAWCHSARTSGMPARWMGKWSRRLRFLRGHRERRGRGRGGGGRQCVGGAGARGAGENRDAHEQRACGGDGGGDSRGPGGDRGTPAAARRDGRHCSSLCAGEWLISELHGRAMGGIRARVDELLTLYRPEIG